MIEWAGACILAAKKLLSSLIESTARVPLEMLEWKVEFDDQDFAESRLVIILL
jgi:hypothetical protein